MVSVAASLGAKQLSARLPRIASQLFLHSSLYAFRLLHFLALWERGYRSLLHQHLPLGLKCSLRSKFPPRVIILISLSGIVTLGRSSSRLVPLVVILYPPPPHCLTLWNVTYQSHSQLQCILFLLTHNWLLLAIMTQSNRVTSNEVLLIFTSSRDLVLLVLSAQGWRALSDLPFCPRKSCLSRPQSLQTWSSGSLYSLPSTQTQ